MWRLLSYAASILQSSLTVSFATFKVKSSAIIFLHRISSEVVLTSYVESGQCWCCIAAQGVFWSLICNIWRRENLSAYTTSENATAGNFLRNDSVAESTCVMSCNQSIDQMSKTIWWFQGQLVTYINIYLSFKVNHNNPLSWYAITPFDLHKNTIRMKHRHFAISKMGKILTNMKIWEFKA